MEGPRPASFEPQQRSRGHNLQVRRTDLFHGVPSYNMNQLCCSSIKIIYKTSCDIHPCIFIKICVRTHVYIYTFANYIYLAVINQISQKKKKLQECDSTQPKSYLGSNLECKNPSLEFTLGRPDWHSKRTWLILFRSLSLPLFFVLFFMSSLSSWLRSHRYIEGRMFVIRKRKPN